MYKVTPKLLHQLFVHRLDCYATQERTNTGVGYWKVMEPLTEDLLARHIVGDVTVGTYQIALDDTVKWCCADIDNHDGKLTSSEVREQVNRATNVLKENGIPFLLEASGSPDSYHIWILLRPTKTYNAYRYIRILKRDSGVDCECFPKQKHLGKDGKYGNLVKIPAGINIKTGVRSTFLDPDTFEPLTELPELKRAHIVEFQKLTPTEPDDLGMPNPKFDEKYVMGIVEKELDTLRSTKKDRNIQLNRAAFVIGTLINTGYIGRGEAERLLMLAALSTGLEKKESEGTIRSGLNAGERHPRG